jgi:perosamine synthetase
MIPIIKPYLTIDEAESAYKTILSGWVSQGPKVKEFEDKFAKYVGAKYAVAVSSCTTALHLALIVAGIKSDDEVICPSMSFIATANSIVYTGAKPVFADIDAKNYNIDPKKCEKLITPKTKAILIAHQVGIPAEINIFKKICKKYHLKLIEDAACAIGSEYKNKKIGSHSKLVCFSFHPRKLLTTGDGGMITTSSKKLYLRLSQLRNHGASIDARKRHEIKKVMIENYFELGYNYRMTDIQAAIGIEQLKKMDYILKKRREIANKYNKIFKTFPYLEVFEEKPYMLTNYQSYCLLLKKDCPVKRDILMKKLLEKGISTRRGIMLSHKEPFYKKLYPRLKLPVSEYISNNSLILPLYVQMEKKEVDYIIGTIKHILKNHS